MRHKVILDPKILGEGITEAFVVEWFKQAGDAIAAGEEIVEMMTDKVNVAIESPVTGRIVETCVLPEARVAVGGVLAIIEDD
jgi:pyruvate/2-oxoglutarate dehydrogenase complex dihydrolipoamide acyltransferase (E2) component